MDLRTWRKTNEITQKKLAAELGIDPAHLSKLERQEVGASLELALKIADVSRGQVSLQTLTKKTTGA